MYGRLLWADLRRSKVISLALLALITLAALLSATSVAMIVQTTNATDALWDRADPPDTVQMHLGDADEAAIFTFAEGRDDVVDHQAERTLPIPGNQLWLGGVSQADSVLEPAFIVAPERFDLLLDEHGVPLDPAPGEVAMPMHYFATGALRLGDTVRVAAEGWERALTVTAFVRDAQMNPAMVTSKRVVVHPEDFEFFNQRLEPEYLVAFKLADGTSPKLVQDAYREAGLPSKGIAIDASIIKLMSGLSVFLVAAMAILVSVLLILTAALALRHAFLAAMEADLAEIATLKAIGTPPSGLRRLYWVKYLVLAGVGALTGLGLSFALTPVLVKPVLLYLGEPRPSVWLPLAPVVAALAVALAVAGFCWLMLRRIDKVSAVEAMRSGTSGQLKPRRHRMRLAKTKLPPMPWLGLKEGLRPGNWLLVAVLGISLFIMVVPAGVAATFQDPRFAAFIGIGDADIAIDVRDGSGDFEAISREAAADPRVVRHVEMISSRYDVLVGDEWESLVVQRGDHSVFPLRYVAGRAPAGESEIALSVNQADTMRVAPGGVARVRTAAGEQQLTVSGTYQDITNGGKTAKAVFDDGAPALWQLQYLSLADDADPLAMTRDLSDRFTGAKVVAVADSASQTFGATAGQLALVSIAAIVVAGGLAFLVGSLFAVLVVARDRSQIATQLALGMTVRDVTAQYLVRFGVVSAVGVLLGVALVAVVGQPVFALALGVLGAPGARLLLNPWQSWLLLPLLLAAVVATATLLALRGIGSTQVSDQE